MKKTLGRQACVRLWLGLVLFVLLPAAASAQKPETEATWIAGRIILDLQRMSAWAQGRAIPKRTEALSVVPIADAWELQMAGRELPVPMKHIWDVSAYTNFCRVTKSAVSRRQSVLPERLLDLRAVAVAVENQTVSERLRTDFKDPLAHEEAALLHAAMVLRENAGRFQDTRHSLARITAHLAFASALRGDQPAAAAGQLAQAVLLIVGGRPVDAMTRIESLPPDVPDAWKDALAAAATRDWRRLVKEKPALLEILVATRLQLQASEGQADQAVLLYAADEKYRGLTDWHRMLLADAPSRHLVIPALPKAMEKETRELTAVWQAYRGGAPAPDYAVDVLNLEPGLCVNFAEDGKPQVAAIDLGTWSAYWQRHLCHAFTFVFARNVLDRRFSELRLYPFVVLQHHRTAAGLSRTILNRAVSLCRQQPASVNALNRIHLQNLLNAAAGLDPDPFEPGPVSPYPAARLKPLPVLGPVPRVDDLEQRLPDADRWFHAVTLPGTAFEPAVRQRLLPVVARTERLLQWQAMDPWNQWLRRRRLQTLTGVTSLADLDAQCGDLLHYDYLLMRDSLPLLRHRPEDYSAMLKRMTAIEPAAYLALAELQLQLGKPRIAVDAMGAATEAGVLSEQMQAYRPWLMEWYMRQNQPQAARKVAGRAAKDESYFGMQLFARFVERNGGDARKYYEVLHRKFWEKCSLLAYFVRQARRDNDRRYDPLVLGLLKQVLMDPKIPEDDRAEARQRVEQIIFPGGRRTIPRSMAQAPQQALVLTKVAAPIAEPPLVEDALLLGFNGTRILDVFQYFLCRLETNARLARLHLWQEGRLQLTNVDLSQWDAGVKVLNRDAVPESPEEAVRQRLARARKQQPDGITKLNLSGLRLKTLPPVIANLPALEALDLSYNRLTALPEEIGNLKRLRFLDLGDNHLGRLPRSLANLSKLQFLSVKDNRLPALPAELGRCRELRTLNAGGNRLRSLPASIGMLANLQALNLYQNRIRELPAGFAQLRNLRRLSLQANDLRGIPLIVFDLPQLQFLYLGDNALDLLPPAIGKLQALEMLDLGRNLLTELPPELEACRALNHLSLGHNRFSELPMAVPALGKLQQLYLNHNYLQTLPPDFKRLRSLKVLALDQNRFRRMPAVLAELPGLRGVYYGDNTIHYDEIRKLRQALPNTRFKDTLYEP